jgi:hypothetical protein
MLLFVVGCGPLQKPMVHRPSDTQQQEIDDAWNRALSPVDKLDRQEWLDLFVGAQAYQLGVDKLMFRSEKAFANGRVVMEVHYDREAPDKDVFLVQVLDDKSNLVRTERYSRQDVEDTYKLLVEVPDGPVDDEQTRRRAERWERITEYFPESAK